MFYFILFYLYVMILGKKLGNVWGFLYIGVRFFLLCVNEGVFIYEEYLKVKFIYNIFCWYFY